MYIETMVKLTISVNGSNIMNIQFSRVSMIKFGLRLVLCGILNSEELVLNNEGDLKMSDLN